MGFKGRKLKASGKAFLLIEKKLAYYLEAKVDVNV